MKYDKLLPLAALVVFVAFLGFQTLPETDVEMEGDFPTFDSEEDMKQYLEEADMEHAAVGDTRDMMAVEEGVDMDVAEDRAEEREATPDGEETFEQVPGIQEPDFAKLGDNLYYSSTHFQSKINTTVLDIPDLKIEENVSEGGQLLLLEEMLVVLNDDRVVAYDMEDFDVLWERNIKDEAEDGKSTRVVSSRAFEDRIFLLLQTDMDYESPCPYRPMDGVTVPCYGIVYPGYRMNVDRAFTALNLDLTGEVEGKTSFIGDHSTEVYVTSESIYVTYGQQEKTSEVMQDFLLEYASVPSELEDRIIEIKNYDLSERSVMIETERAILENMDRDELMDLEKDMEGYTQKVKREVDKTDIIRFDSSLEEDYVATVPGNVIDRMHLHEKEGRLYGLTRISSHPTLSYFSPYYDFFVLEEGDEIEYREEFLDTGHVQTDFIGDRMYVGDREELVVYDFVEGDRTDSFEVGFASVHPFGDGKLLVGRTEDWNTTFVYLDEDLGIQDEVVTDRRRYSRASGVQVDGKTGRAVVTGYHDSFVINLDNGEIDTEKIEVSGRRSFITDEFIYVVDGDKVHSLDEDLNVYSTFEVPTEEVDRPVEPIPEPMVDVRSG